MKYFDISCSSAICDAVSGTVASLRQPGGVAVVPTETVYGLISLVTPEGAERIYDLKHRSGNKQLGWFVGDWRKMQEYGVVLSPLVTRLAERFTPGAITIIAPDESGKGIGFRVPDHPFLSALLAELNVPLLQTSANLSGQPDSLTIADAISGLSGEVDVVVDGGTLPPGSIASTVVDARGEQPHVLRQGAVHLDFADL